MRLNIRTAVTRDLVKAVCGPAAAAYASGVQLVLEPLDGAWHVRPHPDARNPTWLDGARLGPEGAAIGEGAVLSIGPEAALLEARLA